MSAAAAVVAPVANASGLMVLLHPLVIVNVSDHYARTRAQTGAANPQVVGAILGQQTGRTVEVTNSFELAITDGGHVDREYFVTKQTQFRQVFPALEFVGWYATTAAPSEAHVRVHAEMLEFNESPLFLQVDPAIASVAKELPIKLFESFVDATQSPPRTIFIEGTFKLESGDAERIAVNHVATTSQMTNSGGARVITYLQSQRNAVQALRDRIKVLLDYLVDVERGAAEADPELLRAVSAVCHRLPVLETAAFREEAIQEETDGLLLAYLSTLTKASDQLNELTDKFLSTQERQGRRLRHIL